MRKLLGGGGAMGYNRDMYEATGNPWFAWDEYRICRRQGRIPADWVLAYLDRSANALHDVDTAIKEQAGPLFKDDPTAKARRKKIYKRAPAHVVKALEFTNHLGNTDDYLQLTLALRVECALREIKHARGGYAKAVESVVADTGTPASTVKDAYKKFRRVTQNMGWPEPGKGFTVVAKKDKLIPQSTE